MTSFLYRFRKNAVAGIDIGASSVKMVQLMRLPEGTVLARAAFKEFNAGAEGAGEVPREEAVIAALRELLEGVDIRRTEFVASVNCPRTAVRRITAPVMALDELRRGVGLDASNTFPFSVENTVLDVEVTGETVERGVRKYLAVAAIAGRETVDGILHGLSRLGVHPAVLLPVPCALQNLAQHAGLLETEEEAAFPKTGHFTKSEGVVCVIDVGDEHTELAIFSVRRKFIPTKLYADAADAKPRLLFSRKIPVASREFTHALTSVLASERGQVQLSLAEAEKVKRAVGIPQAEETALIEDKISPAQVLSMLRGPLEQFAAEVERCLDFFREEASGERVESVVLCGGGSLTKGLDAFLSGRLGVPVRRADFFVDFPPPREGGQPVSDGPRLAVALGLALDAGGINLLPLEIRLGKRKFLFGAALKASAAALLFLAVAGAAGMRFQTDNFQKRVQALRLEWRGLAEPMRQLREQGLIAQILSAEPHWDDVFVELSRVVPDDVVVVQLEKTEKMIRILGRLPLDKEDRLSDLIFELERGMFRNARLVNAKQLKDEPVKEFEITCWMDEAAPEAKP